MSNGVVKGAPAYARKLGSSQLVSKTLSQRPAASLAYTALNTVFKAGLYRLLAGLLAPLRKLIALNLLLGRSCWVLSKDLQRWLSWWVGWLHAEPKSAALRKLFRPWQVRRWHLSLASVLLFHVLYRGLKKLYESGDEDLKRQTALRAKMAGATSYEEWSAAACELDSQLGSDPRDAVARWKREKRLFDRRLLKERLNHLRAVRERGDVSELMFAVRADLLRNLGNMTNSELHEHWHVAPEPIPQYIEEVKAALEFLADYEGPDLSLDEKLAFLQETRHTFGRTALVLSGGGALGAFHLGIVKTLFMQKLLPRVLSGSSVGAIVCSIIATRTDEELRDLMAHMAEFDLSFFSNSTLSQFLRHFLLKGTLQDIEVLQKRLRRLLGDLTFLEAYRRSGRILNVAVCAADTNEPPRLLNHLTAPDVVIWSAVACSSAFPGLFNPQELLARNRRAEFVRYSADQMRESERRWRDGSLEEDLPMRGLSEMWNCNYFIVSQTNPHIVPALNMKKRFNRKLGKLLEAEWKHRCWQLMEILPDWLPSKWLKVLSQPWEGDITLVLPSTYSQIKKAITNPSRQDLQHACLQGERQVWAKLSAIQCNCGVEITLDKCLARVAAERARQRPPRRSIATGGRNAMASRIPSWLHMPSLGMVSPGSNETLEDAVAAALESHGSGSPRAAASAAFDYSAARQLLPPETPPGTEPGDAADPASSPGAGAPPPTMPRSRSLPRSSRLLSAVEEGVEPAVELAESLDLSALDVGHRPLPFDCCDRSVTLNIWDTLRPLASSSYGVQVDGDNLDFIAP